MKIIFMGTPDFATIILKHLIGCGKFELLAVFTQKDKPVGRKQILTPPDVKKFLQNYPDIKIYQPENLKSKELQNEVKNLRPDFIVVAAYGQILPKEILDTAPCINLHASILPKFRGASPIQASILSNEIYGGTTAMKMNTGLDTGDMLGFSYIKLENYLISELFEKIANSSALLCEKILLNYENIKPLPQHNSISSHKGKITKEEAMVDFSLDAKEIYTKFKAFYGWPNIYIKNGIKIKKLKIVDENYHNYKIGQILKVNEKSIEIACKTGSLEIISLQAPSKKEIDASSFIRGQRKKIGDCLS